jgi:hypothetical protein
MEVTDDHLSGHRVAAKSLGLNTVPREQSPADDDGPDQRYSYSDQSEVAAVTFKDQAQSMIVDGHPMTMMMASSNNIHSSPPPAARTPSSAPGSNDHHSGDFLGRSVERNNNNNNVAAASSDHRRFAYQQQDVIVAPPVTWKDNHTQSMWIRPETIGVPTNTATDQNEDSHSGLTEADDTRGSSDPSGVYSHEMSVLDPHYNGSASNNPRDHHHTGAGSGSAGRHFEL